MHVQQRAGGCANSSCAPAPSLDIGAYRPRTPRELHAFIRQFVGFDIPREALTPGHSAPFDYICHAFFEDQSHNHDRTTPRLPRDCIVWANRGGGKTQLGAIATLLDLIFKPGIQVRILAGSFDQSSRMYRYLRRLLDRPRFRPLVPRQMTDRYVALENGSRVEVLAQSECAVRGQRVHRLRCDEVELFDDEVWAAAQMVTRSGWCGDVFVNASIEVLSTMHRPFGLMRRLIDDASDGSRIVFKWNAIDVLEECPAERDCTSCPLFDSCAGRAKHAAGFLHIDDVVNQRSRIGDDRWQSEMLCTRPSARDRVYPMFNVETHVRPFDSSRTRRGRWIGGIDFGYRAPTVVLRAWHDADDDTLHIVDAYTATERTVAEHIAATSQRHDVPFAWLGADPAGHQRSEHTGRSAISVWRDAGFTIRSRFATIDSGLNAVRARLRAADGSIRLAIDPSCTDLIRALEMYHYPTDREVECPPVKDGPDHACDALRYMITNLDLPLGRVHVRWY